MRQLIMIVAGSADNAPCKDNRCGWFFQWWRKFGDNERINGSFALAKCLRILSGNNPADTRCANRTGMLITPPEMYSSRTHRVFHADSASLPSALSCLPECLVTRRNHTGSMSEADSVWNNERMADGENAETCPKNFTGVGGIILFA